MDFWGPAVKLETGGETSLHELPSRSSTGSGIDELNGNPSGGGRYINGTPEAGGVDHTSDGQEPQGSASPRLNDNAGLRDGQVVHTTARGDLIKVENVSEISSCASSPPSNKSSRSQAPVGNVSAARSPSAAAAEAGIAHDSLEAMQASAEKEQVELSLSQEPTTDQAVSDSDSGHPVATPVENSRKRNFDSGVMEKDADMSKRRRASIGEDACENEDSLAHRQRSHVHQPEANKRSDSLSNGSGPSANQSQDGMSGVQKDIPCKADATLQSAGPSPPPSTAWRVPRHQTREAIGLPVVSQLEGYVPLTMATPQRRYADWEGE